MTTSESALIEFRPHVGIVLGSGLSEAVRRFEVRGEIPYADISGLPASRVQGHRGSFVLFEHAGARVVAACGRVHLYEGYTAEEAAAGVRLMAKAGIRQLLLTNAAGCCDKAWSPGEWMLISDHINLTGVSPLEGSAQFFDMSAVYSRRLRSLFKTNAEACEITLREGVYAGVRGPQYETPAEIRAFRALGSNAIGMSTVVEAIQARALGLEVCGLSLLTNWAAGMHTAALAHSDVLSWSNTAAQELGALLAGTLPGFPVA